MEDMPHLGSGCLFYGQRQILHHPIDAHHCQRFTSAHTRDSKSRGGLFLGRLIGRTFVCHCLPQLEQAQYLGFFKHLVFFGQFKQLICQQRRSLNRLALFKRHAPWGFFGVCRVEHGRRDLAQKHGALCWGGVDRRGHRHRVCRAF